MGLLNRFFGTHKPPIGGDGMREPKFVETYQLGIATYHVYECLDSEIAKTWLAAQRVTKPNCHLYVQTPDGNWGTDVKGIYLEKLRPFQLEVSNSDCAGEFLGIPSEFSFEMHCRGITDNFIADVSCGRCAHKWKDGARIRLITLVRCPNCSAHNQIDLRHLDVKVVFPHVTTHRIELGREVAHKVTKAGDLAAVEKLIAVGMSINARTPEGVTLLHLAARHGQAKVVEYLLDRGADIEARDADLETPLLAAIDRRWCAKSDPEVVRLLVQHGADLQAADKAGWFPLYAAAQCASLPVAEILLSAGAPVNQRTNAGQAPLDRALIEQDRTPEGITLEDRQAMIHLLKRHGAI